MSVMVIPAPDAKLTAFVGTGTVCDFSASSFWEGKFDTDEDDISAAEDDEGTITFPCSIGGGGAIVVTINNCEELIKDTLGDDIKALTDIHNWDTISNSARRFDNIILGKS